MPVTLTKFKSSDTLTRYEWALFFLAASDHRSNAKHMEEEYMYGGRRPMVTPMVQNHDKVDSQLAAHDV